MADNRRSFQWTGIDKQGKRATGVIDATDAKEAQLELKRKNIEVITLTQKNPIKLFQFSLFSKRKKITSKDIILFTRYLSTMITAGLSIVQSLEIIAHDQENPAMKSLINSISAKIAEGKTLSEAFSQYPQYFSDLYINLIQAGEKAGALEKILSRIGGYLERTETLKRKVKKALTYPIAIFSVAIIVSLVLLVFVVPQFQNMFASFGAKLPFFTRIIVNISYALRHYGWLIAIILFFVIWGLRRAYRQSDKMQQRMARYSLKIYIIGAVIQKGAIARFARTLATTIEAGMPIVESMRMINKIMGNRIYSKAVLDISNDVLSGHSLSTSMQSTELFPKMAIQMVAVGEASGKLSEMLNKVADYYEEDVNSIVDNLSTLLEPVIMLVLGVIVGTFVVAMYLPIFKMGSLF